MFWIPFAVFLVHMVEELPRFPAWATRHFGATSTAWYVYSHIALVVIGATVCAAAQSGQPQSWAVVSAAALMLTLAVNACFHVVTTVLFREYSPGVVTGVLLFFPATAVLLRYVLREALLTPAQVLVSFAIGAAVQALVIASLYLKMDIDWRFRRPAPPP